MTDPQYEKLRKQLQQMEKKLDHLLTRQRDENGEEAESSLISVQAAAASIGATRELICRLIKRGELAALNIGTMKKPIYRIYRVALHEWARLKHEKNSR
jgi:excisionase family DNA binding protein